MLEQWIITSVYQIGRFIRACDRLINNYCVHFDAKCHCLCFNVKETCRQLVSHGSIFFLYTKIIVLHLRLSLFICGFP